MQDWPPPQARPQPPQWFGSVAVSTHWSPQLVCPGAGQPQPPLRQVWLDPHRFPQPPQLAESVRRSAHVAPQASSSLPQVFGTSGPTSTRGCPSGLTSGCPPSQVAPEQIDTDASRQGPPSAQRFRPVRPQPTTATTTATSQIPSSAGRRRSMPVYSRRNTIASRQKGRNRAITRGRRPFLRASMPIARGACVRTRRRPVRAAGRRDPSSRRSYGNAR